MTKTSREPSREMFSMVEECVDLYRVIERSDGGIDIHIQVPKRFASLWMVHLGELQTSEAEIAKYDD